MILKKLKVENLFGIFDYEININDDITIITAPNGYGKTFCLKIIHSVFSYNYSFLYNLDFFKIEMESENKTLIIKKEIVEKEDNRKQDLFLEFQFASDFGTSEKIITKKNIQRKSTLVFYILEKNIEKGKSKEKKVYVYDYERQKRELIKYLNSTPNISRVGEEEWIEHGGNFGRRIELATLMNESNYLSFNTQKNIPLELMDFSKDTNSYYIQDQRLLKKNNLENRRNNVSYVQTIETYAKELKNHIIKSRLNHSEVSQELDSTFPQRLLGRDSKNINSSDKDAIVRELVDLNKKREQLKNLDILPKKNTDKIIDESDIDDSYINVLNLYLEDTKKKLSEFDEIYRKVSLFVELLTNKLTFKEIKIDSAEGFYFVRDDKNLSSNSDNDSVLKLSQLSSGEQHEVVLIYELIFNISEKSIVLIDEPEISLHVVWQEQFLDDLKTILDINSSSAVIATHSPQIIGDNWRKTVDLELLRQKEIISQ